jgi:hypothetical protein
MEVDRPPTQLHDPLKSANFQPVEALPNFKSLLGILVVSTELTSRLSYIPNLHVSSTYAP